ncbi:MAG TPA: DUF4340 domain-containing protein, partial [Rhodopila sp.]|nr:DUF4340 domain-containing protein [Rhodopila sp.]
VHQGDRTVIEKRSDGGWGVAAMQNYPVQRAKLRGVLAGLTELRLTERRTSNPAEFSRLGVGDPDSKTATGDLLRVLDASGKPLAQIIVGHRRVRGVGNLPDEVYVRRPDEQQSWLAEGNLQVDADPSQWLDRSIINISHTRIASVVVGDHALVFGRLAGRFALVQPADHPKLESYKVDDVARALEMLSFEQVRADKPPSAEGEAANGKTPNGKTQDGSPAASATGKDEAGKDASAKATAGQTAQTGDETQSVFTTDDGLAVHVTLLHVGKDVWAHFAATGSDKTKAEADKLNARVGGWSYEIGSWKEKSLVPTMDDLKANEPAAKPAASVMPSANTAPGLSMPATPAPAAAAPAQTPAAQTPAAQTPATPSAPATSTTATTAPGKPAQAAPATTTPANPTQAAPAHTGGK